MTLPPRRVGLGALPTPAALTQAQTDLQNQFTAVVQAGDTYLQAGETAQALTTYKSAGAVGAGTIGPEIDLAGYPQASQPFTQKAWRVNAYLQGTQSATDAAAYAHNMNLYYAEAISAATNAATEPPVLALPPLGGSQVALAAALAGVIGALVVHARGAT
jgi:hypothetical protein